MSVLSHVIASIAPASPVHAEEARRRVASANTPLLERLAASLGGAQHTPRPRTTRRAIVVCAGDHGVGDPGVVLGAGHPTVVAAHAIADGTAALAQLARASRTPIVLVDAGVVEAQAMPTSMVRLGRGAPSRNLTVEPAMTIVDASLGLEAGIALAVSLADDGLDVLATGALGVGADVASAALLGTTGAARPELGDGVAEAAFDRGASAIHDGPLAQLAAFGGPETCVLAGLMLGAASMNVPIILDGYATGAAALAAVAFAPAVAGFLIAAHAGTFTQGRILAQLGIAPLFELGLGYGEGTGAAMILPLTDQVAALASRG